MLRKLLVGLTCVVFASTFALAGCKKKKDDGERCGDGICGDGEDATNCFEDCGCGNDLLNTGEECDGAELGGIACEDLLFTGGTLGCTTACTYDLTACTGGCGNGVQEDQEDCDGADLNNADCISENFDGGALDCDDQCSFVTTGCCNNDCTPSGASQCSGTVIETCTAGADTCLDWVSGTDCANTSQLCDDSGATAQCVDSCTDQCPALNDLRCNVNVLEVCNTQANGCLDWETQTDCGANSQVCAPVGGTPQCITNGAGDSCADLFWVTNFPFTMDGTDITADYTNAHDFNGTGCTTGNGVEAVFAVTLDASDMLHVYETGIVDSVLRVLDTCDATTGVCLESEDLGSNESGGFVFVAPAAGTYYVVFEAYYATTSNVEYSFHLDRLYPENCGDGIDNDGDGLVDCMDDDCFGDTTYCSTEAICWDGQDNDADSDTDCADSDCSTSIWCGDLMGYWEKFESGDLNDLEGCSLTFTPDSGDPNLYTYAYGCPGLSAFPVTPGTGDASTVLALGDDDFEQYTLSVMTTIDYFGVAFDNFFVGSNGYITFDVGDTWRFSTTDDGTDLWVIPTIAGIATDLDPDSGNDGTITVDEFSNQVVVTFDQVPVYLTTQYMSFQIVVHSTGVIDLHYLAVPDQDRGFVGISSGGATGLVPAETDFVPPPPPLINEVVYDDNSTDDQEFIELYAPGHSDLTGFTLVHFNGSDGSVTWEADLTGISVPLDGFVVIGPAGTPNLDVDWSTLSISSIQNGPDSLVIFTNWDSGNATGDNQDAVEWETGANPSYAEGSPHPGVPFSNFNTGIGRYLDGEDIDDNATDFVVSRWPTPGEPNAAADLGSAWDRATATSHSAEAASYPLAIPDNDSNGLTTTIDTTSLGWIPNTVGDIHVGIRIKHTYIGDLVVVLTSPDGTSVSLHNLSGGGTDDIETVYDLETAVDVGSMNDFTGENARGVWSLYLEDTWAGDVGDLVEWVIWIQ